MTTQRAIRRRNRHEPFAHDVRPGVLVLIIGIAAAGFVALTAAVILYRPFHVLDAALSGALRDASGPNVEAIARAVTYLGDGLVVAVLALFIGSVLWVRRRRSEAIFVVAVVATGWLAGYLLKLAVERIRPYDLPLVSLPESFSFPSGHALSSFLLFGALAIVVMLEVHSRRLRWAIATVSGIIVVLVGMSRIILGVHWFGDVIGSWLLGAAWLAAGLIVLLMFSDAATDTGTTDVAA